MSDQNFKNHAQMVPGYHYVTGLGLIATVIGSVVHLVGAWGTDVQYAASLLVALSVFTVMAALYARIFALKAQDRAIRAEENLRNFARNGALLDPKLTMRQIIGLRFASDAEYDELAKKAVANNMSEKEIKQAIKNWKADTYRV